MEAHSHPLLARVHRAIENGFAEDLDRCRRFLRQKSVSASGEGIQQTARTVTRFIEEIGGQAHLTGPASHPIVYGRVGGSSPRTLIIYGMYDVQPVEESKWASPPFAAELQVLPGLGECVIARGAVNSKGALCGLFNALRAICRADRLPLNLIFTIEGEEEIGSPHFEQFIRSHRDELAADGVVDFDFSEDSKGRVSMHLGLKGIVYLNLVCRGGARGGPTVTPVHGSVSAWISSPVWRLIHALASLTDEREDIVVEGIRGRVADLSSAEKEILRRLADDFDEKAFLVEMKSLCFRYDRHGIELLRKGLYSPIVNIDGFHAGYTGTATKTVLPRKASAKIDIRFGPDLEPDEVVAKLREHLSDRGFDDIEIEVKDSYTWSKTDPTEPIVQKMIRAYRWHGVEPQVWPIATWAAPYFVFSRILRLPVVSGGLGHGGRQHVANEYMTVKGLLDFERFVATLLYLLAED
ncbi:MAG: M20/M25/M40 family metallo-hydrolase [Acidobacteria bacterium]|nr:M20/M25/M40 family metallo-hydrolase [Acidobacteriota bacterium]